MWKSDIEIFALTILPPPNSSSFPCFSLNLQPPSPLLLPAPLLSLIEFNSALGDSVIDRLRETEEIWFKPFFFFTVHILCQIFFFFFPFTVPWALQLIASSKLNHHHHPPPPPSPTPPPLLPLHTFPPHWTLASHSCLTRCGRERKRE